jgi:hypothetical protein
MAPLLVFLGERIVEDRTRNRPIDTVDPSGSDLGYDAGEESSPGLSPAFRFLGDQLPTNHRLLTHL